MTTEALWSLVRGIPAAGLQHRRAVDARVVRVGVFPAGLGKSGAGKIFEEFSWKPEVALFFPLGCQSRMMD